MSNKRINRDRIRIILYYSCINNIANLNQIIRIIILSRVISKSCHIFYKAYSWNILTR